MEKYILVCCYLCLGFRVDSNAGDDVVFCFLFFCFCFCFCFFGFLLFALLVCYTSFNKSRKARNGKGKYDDVRGKGVLTRSATVVESIQINKKLTKNDNLRRRDLPPTT